MPTASVLLLGEAGHLHRQHFDIPDGRIRGEMKLSGSAAFASAGFSRAHASREARLNTGSCGSRGSSRRRCPAGKA